MSKLTTEANKLPPSCVVQRSPFTGDTKGTICKAMLNETAWVPTTEASRLLGRSASYLKRQRETHGGFLEAGRHYAMAPSSNATITWNVPLIRKDLHRRAQLTQISTNNLGPRCDCRQISNTSITEAYSNHSELSSAIEKTLPTTFQEI